VSEMRYRAVLEVLDGAVISVVARRYGVSRQTVHAWLRRYARDGAVLNLEARSSRPHRCPHQMAPGAFSWGVRVLFGPGRFGRRRTSRWRRSSSPHPCGRAIRRSGRPGPRAGG
jgi:hypothetical protein